MGGDEIVVEFGLLCSGIIGTGELAFRQGDEEMDEFRRIGGAGFSCAFCPQEFLLEPDEGDELEVGCLPGGQPIQKMEK